MQQQKGCLSRLASFTAGVFVVLVMISFPLSLLAQSIEARLFSPETLANQVESRLISSGYLREVLSHAVFQGDVLEGLWVEGADLSEAFTYLSEEEQQEIVGRLLPEDWLTQQVDFILDSTFSWLESTKLQPDWRMDLSPLRDNLLRGGGAASTAEIMIASWPECSAEEDRLMLEFLSGGTPPVALCEPSEPLRYQLLDEATRMFRDMAEELPMEIQLGDQLWQGASPERIQALKDVILAYQSLMSSVVLLPWLFLGLIMALVIRSWSALLRWWGAGLGFGGVFGLLIAQRLSNLQGQQIAGFLEGVEQEAPQLATIVAKILSEIAGTILESFALSNLLWAIGGLGALFFGWLIKRGFRLTLKREKAPAMTAPQDELHGSSAEAIMDPPPVDPLLGGDDSETPDSPSGIYG